MDGARTRVRPGLAVLTVAVLLGAAACGDDDGASGAVGAGDADDEAGAPSGGAGTGDGDDPCDLLGVDELVAQFGAQGAAHEGQSQQGQSPEGLDAVSCIWEIGDTSDGVARVNLSIMVDPNESGAQFLATRRDASEDPIEAPSLGEGAFVDFNGVYFLADDVAVQLSALLPDLDGLQDKLVALAELVQGRL